jgi:hypothetical protein
MQPQRERARARTMTHAALRAGAQRASAQVAALQRWRRDSASIGCRSLLLPPSLGRMNSNKTT